MKITLLKKLLQSLQTKMDNKTLPTPQNVPTPNLNLQPKFDPEEEKKEINFLKKVVEINVGLNLLIGGILLILVAVILIWRFGSPTNFLESKNAVQKKAALIPTPIPYNPQEIKKLADESGSYVYINEQGLNLDDSFKQPPSSIKLNLTNQLKKEVMGFLPYWVLPRADDLNISLLTSVSFFGLEVNGDGDLIKVDTDGKAIDSWSRFQSDPNLNNFIKKLKKNRTKVFVTIKCFNQRNITKLSTDPTAQANFIKTALYILNSKSLDGINIDFEYIGTPDKKVIDGYTLLMINLNKELKREYPDAKLTIDTFVDAATNTRLHDIPILAQNSDALIIMGYDFHTPNSAKAGPVAPLQGSGYSLNSFLNNYLEKAPSEKLILAVPYYGYDWPVFSTNSTKTTGSRSDVKVLPYAEIAQASQKSQINWDNDAQTPYYNYQDAQTHQTRVVHFENPRSLGIKYDLVNQKNLQGVGIWALGYDGRRTELLQLLSDKFAK